MTACSYAHGRTISCDHLGASFIKIYIEVGSCRDTNISDGAGLSRKTLSAYASVGGCSGKCQQEALVLPVPFNGN